MQSHPAKGKELGPVTQSPFRPTSTLVIFVIFLVKTPPCKLLNPRLPQNLDQSLVVMFFCWCPG